MVSNRVRTFVASNPELVRIALIGLFVLQLAVGVALGDGGTGSTAGP